MQLRDWPLPGPDALTLTKAEVAAFLRMSTKALDRLVDLELFPPGDKSSKQAGPVWAGDIVAAWVKLRPWLLSGPVTEAVLGEEEQDEPPVSRKKG